MTVATHMVGYNRACVHTDQPACAVLTRAQLETLANLADHDNNRPNIIIDGIWLTIDDVHEILIEMWGHNA